MVTDWLIRLAQWILRDELASSRRSTKALLEQLLRDQTLLLDARSVNRRTANRINALREWCTETGGFDNGRRFMLDYAEFGPGGNPVSTAGVHPASRWLGGQSYDWERKYGLTACY